MKKIPLDSKLDNGATVADWLGTAAVAAAVAARKLTDVREQKPEAVDPARDIADAAAYLASALEEVQKVRAHLVGRARPDYDPRVDHPERFMSEDVRQV